MGRTAVAVRGLPDSGLLLRLTRGRAWIGVLSVLLTGIVALNVISLSLSAGAGRIAQQTQGLEQKNAALRALLAGRLSNHRVQMAAERAGMVVPSPGAVTYLGASGQLLHRARQLAAAASSVPAPTAASAAAPGGPAVSASQSSVTPSPGAAAPTSAATPTSAGTPPAPAPSSTHAPSAGGVPSG